VQALADRLLADFSAGAGGYALFAALPLLERAVVSDQLLSAAQAVVTNLGEARMHEQDLARRLRNGVPFAEPTAARAEEAIRQEMDFVGFYRAIGSALDCAAATAIGVSRLPYSVRRASFNDLLRITPEAAAEHEEWERLRALIAAHADTPPGWLRWTIEMRNAYMHRARLMNLNLQRDLELPRLALPAYVMRQLARERVRFEPHARRRPWAPDMQHLAQGGLPDAIIAEPAVQTMRGVFTSSNSLVERLAELALEVWVVGSEIPVPIERWKLEPRLEVDFAGFAPGELRQYSAVAVSPRDAERIALVARLQHESRL
jgi:hypothetical protein